MLCQQCQQCKQCQQCQQFIARCYLHLWWYFLYTRSLKWIFGSGLLFFVRDVTIGTSVRTHILLSPDSLPPRAFPFEMFIWILLLAPYLYAHISICISFNVPFCNSATHQFSIYFEYPRLPKSAIFGLRKIFGNMWEWMFSCAHLHFQLPPLPTPPIPLVGMKPLAQQHFFCWTQIHFNKIQRSVQIRFNYVCAYHSVSAHVTITSSTPTILSPFLLRQQTHKTQLNLDVAISQIWPLCFCLPPTPKMSPNLSYLRYNAK